MVIYLHYAHAIGMERLALLMDELFSLSISEGAICKTLIAGLAQSIRTDGLLQNLVVRPDGDGIFRVISSKRRFLALQLLRKQGAIDDTYPVTVEIRDNIDDHDAMRSISTPQ